MASGEWRVAIPPPEVYENWLRDWVSAVIVQDINEETIHRYASIGLELKKKGTPIPTKSNAFYQHGRIGSPDENT